MVDQIHSAQKDGLINVVSLHNFCPIPEGLPRPKASPDYYSLSSPNEEERARALLETKHTIDTATKLGAKFVILHTGRVEVDPGRLRWFYSRVRKNVRHEELLKADLIKERESKKERYLSSAMRSLEELSDYSQKAGVLLGIENRYYLHEIPSLDEIGIILDRFGDTNISYWHDTGHAQVSENLAICKHKDYLDRFGARMIGVHLHDVVGCDDHRAPGKGNLGFRVLTPYLREETCLVFEPHYPVTGRQIKKGVRYLESLFDKKVR